MMPEMKQSQYTLKGKDWAVISALQIIIIIVLFMYSVQKHLLLSIFASKHPVWTNWVSKFFFFFFFHYIKSRIF